MRQGPCILVLAALLALDACASSRPSKFFGLAPVPASGAASSAGPQTPSIRVAAIHIPAMLDRQEIARLGTGHQLEISGQERWGAPLDEMTLQTLTRDLIERLPAGKVILPGAPAPPGVRPIVVNVLQFQSDVAGNIVFEGSWSLLEPDAAAPVLVRNFRYAASASPPNTSEEVGGMSMLLGQLADDIANNLPAH
jgi:uncharacterized protein